MTPLPKVHDHEIVGIAFSRERRTLELTLRDRAKVHVLGFSSVVDWSLTPFQEQNVLFELLVHRRAALPDHLPADLAGALRVLPEDSATPWFELVASVGMAGFIVAEQVVDRGVT